MYLLVCLIIDTIKEYLFRFSVRGISEYFFIGLEGVVYDIGEGNIGRRRGT